jgi:pyruvate dehydrogenase E2 component (dihydrolipoamide acetyltransferase)
MPAAGFYTGTEKMVTKIHMEALSPTMEEGQLVRWLKAEGDAIANGDILAEIETDKATMELVARGEGVLRKILISEGMTTPVGEVIGIIAEAEEDISGLVGETTDGPGDGGAGSEAKASDVGRNDVSSAGSADVGAGTDSGEKESGSRDSRSAGEEAGGAPTEGGGRVKASPLARRVAGEAGIDIGAIAGSGPGGRVVLRDVESARTMTSQARPRNGGASPMRTDSGRDYADLPLSQMRKTIAKRLVESIGPVPHFFLRIEVDMTRTLSARKRVNALLEDEGLKLSINDFILKAVAQALEKHPEVNAHWVGDAVRRHFRVHLGVAVAVEDGLITPVIRDANRKSLAEISVEVRELAERGREKKLQPEEYTGSTFSVSNLGMFGIQEFTGVINPPEAGILAIGGIEDTPTIEKEQVVSRPIMRVTMSCDHRVIDGATGARFLQTLRQMLEEPAAILV